MKGLKLLLPEQHLRKEDVMQTPEAVAAMQRLYGLGWGLRRIAAELGCSRNTVKHSVREGGWVSYRVPRRVRKLGHLEEWLATRFRQHRGNADVVRQELQKEHGLTVSLRTVERAVQPWRQQLAGEAQATVRFETAPGRQLQMIDFGTTTGRIGAERVTIHLFVATLGFSRRAYIQVFDHERQSAWLDGLEGAFQYFGGLPEEVLLDNARALVEHHDPTTRVVVFNSRLLAFARYWGFQPRACAPYRARTKAYVSYCTSIMRSNTNGWRYRKPRTLGTLRGWRAPGLIFGDGAESGTSVARSRRDLHREIRVYPSSDG